MKRIASPMTKVFAAATFALTAFALTALASPAAAQEQPAAEIETLPRPTARVEYAVSTVIDQIEEQVLRATIGGVGAEATKLNDPGTLYRIAYSTGAVAVLRRTGCGEAGCKGLLMLGIFTLKEGMDAAQAAETARRFSQTVNPVSVIINEKGEHVVKGYVLFEGGVTIGHVVSQLALFGNVMGAYSKQLYANEGDASQAPAEGS